MFAINYYVKEDEVATTKQQGVAISQLVQEVVIFYYLYSTGDHSCGVYTRQATFGAATFSLSLDPQETYTKYRQKTVSITSRYCG